MEIAVMGASGRTGGRIARALLEAGVKVRALGRDAARLAGLKGAQLCIGDPADAEYLADAFHGVHAAYCLLPYDPSAPGYLAAQARQGEAMAAALMEGRVGRVVFLSSLGAEQPGGTGAIVPIHDQEQRLRAIPGLDAIFLRAGAFFENLDWARAGTYVDAVDPDVRFPMVATRDIADAAVAALLDPSWRGIAVREVLGPCDMSYAEAVAIVNGPGRYVQAGYAEVAEGLRQAGLAPDLAELTVGISRALNEGRIKSLAGRSAANSTPTRYEDYVAGLG